jgi:hypothetical protein
MKSFFTAIIASIALLCALSLAQEAAPAPTTGTTPQAQQSPLPPQSAPSGSAQVGSMQSPSAQASSTPRIAPGSVIPVQLTKGIDAKKVKTGDEVEAKVTQDMKSGNGEIIVPKDTRVIGRVTEAQPRNKEQKESQVGIAFDRAVMKTGGDVNLPMSIQAIIAPSYLSANNGPGAEATGQQQSAAAGGASQSGRTGGMAGSQAPPNASPSAEPTQDTTGNGAHQPITGKTQGVLGIPNMTLSTGATQGSVVTSEKNNVKLESGTMMLLRVGTSPQQ